MVCPNCYTMMREVQLDENYNQRISIDQCQQCGGLWFDPHEYYLTSKENTKKLESLNRSLLQVPSPINNELICPNDKIELSRFTDPNFPKYLDVERCQKCGGMFFNRGELTQYHNWKEDKQNKRADPLYEEQIKRLLESDSQSQLYSNLCSFGKFLNTPYYSPRTGDEKRNVSLANNIMGIIFSLIRQLV